MLTELLTEKLQFLSQATMISAVNKLLDPWRFNNRLLNSRRFNNQLLNPRRFNNQIAPEIIVVLRNLGLKHYNKRNYVTIPYNSQ